MSSVELFFWICLFLTVYPYLVYPPAVVAWSRYFGRGWKQGDCRPTMTLLISVYNEAGVILQKLENALALDYPTERLQIIVISDGSTDGTEQLAESLPDERIVVRSFPERAGKTLCLNRVVPEAKGDILVFTDANSMFPPEALKTIASNFSDPQVGLVTGWTRYRRGETDEPPGLYSRLEKAVKLAESRVSSCVGADGAIFAVRKSLYRPLDAVDINDFIIPLRVVGQKHRAVLDPLVYCVEEPAEGFLAEFRRQIRITNRTLGAIRRNPGFLNPFSSGRFAWLLLSHKLLRFMVPFFASAMLASCLWLSLTNNFFRGLLAVVLLFILVGAVGLARRADSRVVNLCSLFLLTSIAQAVAWIRFVAGKSDTLWTPQR